MGTNSRSWWLPLVILALLGGALLLRAHPMAKAGSADRHVGEISAAERAATFAYDPGAAAADQQAVAQAVADARPEAQQLIAAVDGLVDLHVATTAEGTVGTTESVGNRYAVTLNLGYASRRYGRRGVDRLVLHELGHVVDFALVPAALDTQLDARIPRGFGCDQGLSGACAIADERFAESFAKWATGDIGVGINFGYKVPPPDDLESWGAPLASLLTDRS
jgi:hypothetical protein